MFGLLQLTVRCSDIPIDELADAAREIQEDFRKYRPWHRNVRCQIDGTSLILRAQNDFDEDGEILADELAACLKEQVSAFGSIEVLAVEPMPDPPSGVALAVPRASAPMQEAMRRNPYAGRGESPRPLSRYPKGKRQAGRLRRLAGEYRILQPDRLVAVCDHGRIRAAQHGAQ